MDKSEIPAEGNVVTPEEFSEIENKEKVDSTPPKPPVTLGKVLLGLQREISTSSSGPKEGFTELNIKLERLLGRLELLDDSRKHTDERMNELSEKIGELRSSFMDRDRSFNEAMTKFEKVWNMMEGLEPEKIRAELNKRDKELEQMKSKADSDSERISALMAKLKDVSDKLGQLEGLKDVLSIAEDLDKKRKIMEDIKRDVERNAGKFETRIYELNEAVSGMRRSADKVDSNEETLKDLLRTVDKLSISFDKYRTGEEISQKEKDIYGKISELKFDTESKISSIVKAMKASDKSLVKLPSEELGEEKNPLLDNVNKILEENTEKYDQKFADIEMTLLELSKSVDHRIERHADKESKDSKEPRSSALTSFPGQALGQEVRYTKKGSSPSQVEDLKGLADEVYAYLDSGNHKEARTSFIKLLSLYEKQETSNPFILAKISDLHKKMKQAG